MFWNVKGILHVDFMERSTTITSAVHYESLKSLRRAIQNNCRGLLAAGVVFELLTNFKWDVLYHIPYSPGLAPSDLHLFP